MRIGDNMVFPPWWNRYSDEQIEGYLESIVGLSLPLEAERMADEVADTNIARMTDELFEREGIRLTESQQIELEEQLREIDGDSLVKRHIEAMLATAYRNPEVMRN